jgi:hypothetical protein
VGSAVCITPLAPPPDLAVDEIPVGADTPEGPACLLVHDEDEDMADLRQLTLRGHVRGGVLHVGSRHGSLEPGGTSTLDQLRSLRRLRSAARANRPLIRTWSAEETQP